VNLRINKVHFPVTVLGPGQRIGIWLQGCSIGCPGCCSQDTWNPKGGGSLSVQALLGWCQEIGSRGLDGITISGGEPFDQSAALLELLRALREWRDEMHLSLDVLVYTGYLRRTIERKHAEHLNYVDVLVPGPYRQGVPSGSALTGSGNQEVCYLNAALRSKYERWLGEEARKSRKTVQLAVDAHGVWLVGIPRSGDLIRLQQKCREAGLTLSGSSWYR
jgi:anaerobic ribonucleoside-triphosphate reductase activating protein